MAHRMLRSAAMKHTAERARSTRFGRYGAQLRTRTHRYHLGIARLRRRRGACRRSTLLALVQEVQRRTRTDAEVVRVVRRLVNSGAVILTGNFAGHRL
jgi:hypothetical protein